MTNRAQTPASVDDLILVSVDDHVVEPGNLFDGRLAARYAGEAPKLVRQADGTDVWHFQGQVLPNIGLNAVVGRPPAEYGVDPASFDEMRPGCFDIDARVGDMNANGVLGSMCFPSFPQFCGQLFARTKDKDLALALVRAYNDWHVEQWCGTHPGRFIPLAIPPLWDPELMAAEVHRMAAKGCHAVTFSENPEKLKHPSFHSEYWDPFWMACQEEATVICLHIGSSSELVITSVEAPVNVMITLQPVNIVQAAADLVWSRVLHKFPGVRFALSEGGIGWIPYFLERADYVYRHHREWTGADLGGHLPSELFAERIICCFIDDKAGLEQLRHLNINRVAWECDYPHSDSTWPNSPEILAPSLAGLTPHEVERITHRNAMELFRYDPFVHRPPERCTVGALRAEAAAAGVDVANIARTHAAPRDPAEGPITVMDLVQRATASSA